MGLTFAVDVLWCKLKLSTDIHLIQLRSLICLQFASGNGLLKGSTPLCHRYGGHQFGVWADQLGDGRAHMLGEYVNEASERWELQLKVWTALV